MEELLLGLLKKNHGLTLNYEERAGQWFVTGDNFRSIALTAELEEAGYSASSIGIYRETKEGKKEYLALFCFD